MTQMNRIIEKYWNAPWLKPIGRDPTEEDNPWPSKKRDQAYAFENKNDDDKQR